MARQGLGYDAELFFEDVLLTVAPSETVVMLGTNGNGESTLMKCVMRMLPPAAGPIIAEIDDERIDLVGRSTEAIVDLWITLVTEDRRLFPELTADGRRAPSGRWRGPNSRATRLVLWSYATSPALRVKR